MLTGLYNFHPPPPLWLHCAESYSYSIKEKRKSFFFFSPRRSGYIILPVPPRSAVATTHRSMIYEVHTHQIVPNELYCY